jgi:hypothetical protein
MHKYSFFGSSWMSRLTAAMTGSSLKFNFNPNGGGKRNAEDTGGPEVKGPRTTAQALLTPEGVDVSIALEKITLLCSNLDMRQRNVEAAVYITVETLHNHPLIIAGLKGGQEHHTEVTKATKERWAKTQKKEIGGPALYVAYNWLEAMGEAADNFTGKAKEELADVFKKANNVHFMDQVFSHSQTWITKDKKNAYLRFKMQPWYSNLEIQFIEFLKAGGPATIKGQAAPRGVRVIEVEELMEPIKGKGKGKRNSQNEDEAY